MASSENFQKVKDCLKPQDIFLKACNSFTDRDFDPRLEDVDNLVYQFAHVVKDSEVTSILEDGIETHFYRVYIDLGCRFILEEELQKKEPIVSATIEAQFCAEYLMADKELDEEALKFYALHNASYHVWPYWREYLMNMCNRFNLPKIPVPTMQIEAQNGDDL